MNIPCDIILDLIPLVKDDVASDESKRVVMEHIKNCDGCKSEFESFELQNINDINDKKILRAIRQKVFLIPFVLLIIGVLIGVLSNKNISSNIISIIITLAIGILSIVIVWRFMARLNLKGEDRMRRFFVGKAMGTLIVFGLIGIYLLIKFVVSLL